MDIAKISKILNRDYPLLLLDGVTHVKSKKSCKAFKNLTYNEWFFPKHFPERPIMPGSLQIEAFTQAIALPLLLETFEQNSSPVPILLAGVDKVRFYDAVIPGHRLDILANIDRLVMGVASATAIGSVKGKTVSECKITYKLIEGE
jgi:3-hydroxyacyl-[acyl-carrier-protein] dehydratase